MLLKKDLLSKIDKKYKPMFKDISIPDFTKCIAQFSGLHISKVADSAIEDYLIKWAENKYRFFKLMGNKLRYDTQIQYEEGAEKDIQITRFHELAKEYPAYALWFNEFDSLRANKIDFYYLSYQIRNIFEDLFPNRSLDGISLTHFFKNYLSASDDLVTKIGRIFENQKIEANFTISIDPVDMMLASENPYNWTSCYRLEDGCHGDGTLAAMLDDSSLITYIWDKEGDFSLYGNYDFKHLRYKKMREYISISPSMNSIHFNSIYPGKTYPDAFEKTVRGIIEDFVDKDAIWIKNTLFNDYRLRSSCDRLYYYGYGEFADYSIYIKKGSSEEEWKVYNKPIVCSCGCGNYLYESDDDNLDMRYNGEGFTVENYYVAHYCEIIEDYCEGYDGGEGCQYCAAYNRENAVCELDEEHYCEGDVWVAQDEIGNFDAEESNVVHCNPKFCSSCPFYELHHQKDIDDENDDMRIAEMSV